MGFGLESSIISAWASGRVSVLGIRVTRVNRWSETSGVKPARSLRTLAPTAVILRSPNWLHALRPALSALALRAGVRVQPHGLPKLQAPKPAVGSNLPLPKNGLSGHCPSAKIG